MSVIELSLHLSGALTATEDSGLGDEGRWSMWVSDTMWVSDAMFCEGCFHTNFSMLDLTLGGIEVSGL